MPKKFVIDNPIDKVLEKKEVGELEVNVQSNLSNEADYFEASYCLIHYVFRKMLTLQSATLFLIGVESDYDFDKMGCNYFNIEFKFISDSNEKIITTTLDSYHVPTYQVKEK